MSVLSELTCLELAVGLWFVHVLAEMATAGGALTTRWLLSSRDEAAQPKGALWGRANRAHGNFTDSLVVFAALDLGLIVTHHDAGWAPTLWIAGRVLYLPLYLFNVIYARTLAFAASVVGLALMLAALAHA
jgi:uncharacterized MAPEG superfamily protein